MDWNKHYEDPPENYDLGVNNKTPEQWSASDYTGCGALAGGFSGIAIANNPPVNNLLSKIEMSKEGLISTIYNAALYSSFPLIIGIIAGAGTCACCGLLYEYFSNKG